MGLKKCMFFAVLVSLILSGFPAFAYAEVCETEETIMDVLAKNAVELLEKGYSEYYEFCGYDVVQTEHRVKENIVEETFYLEIRAMLLADSVSDLDFYNGIQDYWNASVSANSLFVERNFGQAAEYRLMVASAKNTLQDSLEQYIGEEQPLRFYVKAIYNMGDYNNASFLFENGEEYVEAEGMYPLSREELQARGYAMMECYSAVALSEVSKNTETKASGLSYNNTAAVAYAATYTSNPSSCSFHQNSCGKYVDTAKYNNGYTNYASTHQDCANYISQCLYAGGIPTDDTWYAGSLAWVNVSELCNYMLNNGYWREISYLMPPVGAYMRYTNISHIVMLSSHDGVTYKYSGHTNDRMNFVLSLSSSNKYYFINFN